MKRLFIIVLMIFIFAGGLWAGGGSQVDKPSRVTLALSGNPSTLDPHSTTATLTFQTTKSLYDTLLEPDSQGRLVPALAEAWSISPDNMAITFQLRRGVSFHDGASFSSRDVKASLERLIDPDFASPNYGDFAVIDRVETPDSTTVIIRLKEPSSPILYALASDWAAILPAEKIAANHDFAVNPVGTGPFSLVQWRQDESITMVKNENYWMTGFPAVDEVVLRIIPESSLQIQGILSGEIDIIYLVDTEDLPVLEASGGVTIDQTLSSLVLVIAMNTEVAPMNNPLFRQALAHGIQKQQVLDVAYGGGTPVGTFIDAGNAFYRDFNSLYPYNPELARQKLSQSGYDGTPVIMTLPQNFPPHVRAGEIYQDMLRRVGINIELRLVDWATWIGEVYSNANYQLTVIGHTGKLDPHGRFVGYGAGDMYVRWTNPEVVELIEQGSRVFPFNDRKMIYDRVQELFAQDLPFFYLGSSNRTVAASKRISGFVMTPVLDTFDFRRVQIRE